MRCLGFFSLLSDHEHFMEIISALNVGTTLRLHGKNQCAGFVTGVISISHVSRSHQITRQNRQISCINLVPTLLKVIALTVDTFK